MVSDLSRAVGVVLRELRRGRGLRQRELADAIGERQSVVSALEGGRREAYLRHIEAAARALGVTPAGLVGRAHALNACGTRASGHSQT